MARYRFCSFYLAIKQLAATRKNDMNNPASDWLVLIRPLLAGFDSTRDTIGESMRTKDCRPSCQMRHYRNQPTPDQKRSTARASVNCNVDPRTNYLPRNAEPGPRG